MFRTSPFWIVWTLSTVQATSFLTKKPRTSLTIQNVTISDICGPQIGGANFPDPSIIKVKDTWYAFATRTIGSQIHIQIASSPDFSSWTIIQNENGTQRDALPDLPPWVYTASPNTWAPDVVALNDGTYVMYYSASTTSDTSKHCVGAAVSDDVLGPYKPLKDPLFCPLSAGGAIDADGYLDGSQLYVVYKVDGNSIGHGGPCGNTVEPIVPTPLVLQPVAADGYTIQGNATTLLDNQGAADDGILEAPSLVKIRDTYVLFFSSGCFTTPSYTVSYATASAVTGPYSRAAAPLLKSGDDNLTAPGGADIYLDGHHMVFHANSGNGRALYTALIGLQDDCSSSS